jgi:TATA-box binding protein (TBP) (component of TFIID and TFIIIB)
MELESKIMAKHDPTSFAIFVPEEYPGLVWIDSDGASEAVIDTGAPELRPRVRTLVFPSGAIIVHGSKIEEMETSLRKKLQLIQKCMRSIPESIANVFRSHISNS